MNVGDLLEVLIKLPPDMPVKIAREGLSDAKAVEVVSDPGKDREEVVIS